MIPDSLNSLARLMAAMHLNRIRFAEENGRRFVLKRRRFYSPLVIFFGNWVSRLRTVPVVVLQGREWLAWESRMNLLVNGTTAARDGAGFLRAQMASGSAIQDAIASGRQSPSEVAEPLEAAARALRVLHETRLPNSDILLSHGDATVRNSAYDPSTKTVRWFDFDLAHDMRTPANLRHADDLRALVFSALPYLDPGSLPHVVRRMLSAYGDSPALRELGRLIGEKRLNRDLFHLAQTLASRDRRDACRTALTQAIAEANPGRRWSAHPALQPTE